MAIIHKLDKKTFYNLSCHTYDVKVGDPLEKYPFDFTRSGLLELFDYLEELSSDTGEDIEFDPVGFCRAYAEYDLQDYNDDYGTNYTSFDDLDEVEEPILRRFTDRRFVYFNRAQSPAGEWVETEKVLVNREFA